MREDTYKPNLEAIKEEYETLINDLPGKLPFKKSGYRDKKLFPMLTKHIKAGMKYRIAHLTKNAVRSFEEKDILTATILTRSIFETACMLFWLHNRIEKILRTNDFDDIDKFLFRMSFGDRRENKVEDELDFDALNIMTGIDKLDKALGVNTREIYGFLCEFAHPNFHGTFGYFAKMNKEQTYVDFSFDNIYNNIDEPEGVTLSALHTSLMMYNNSDEGLEKMLSDFEKICSKGE